MSAELLKTINGQLLELDRMNGNTALSLDVLRAFKATVATFEGDNTKDGLLREFCKLHDLFMGCRPRMAQVILDTQQGLLHFNDEDDMSENAVQKVIDASIAHKEVVEEKIVKNTASMVAPGSILFLHSYSTQIAAFLRYMAEEDKRPQVLVAEQEAIKTAKLLKLLDKCGYEFRVVSEYSTSHVLDKIDIALFGALTINNNREVVLAPGSSGLVSDIHRSAIPLYALLATGKFSYWEEDYEPMFTETRKKDKYGVAYEKDIYSHDILPLKLFSGAITEKGVMSHGELMALFAKQQKTFLDGERRIKELKKKWRSAA